MKPSQIAKAIRRAVKAQRPMFIWGQPGVGKSSVLKSIAEEDGLELSDLRLSLLDPVDLRGFPYRDGNTMRWAPADMLPQDPNSRGILFLDEMNAAPPATQAAAYQLVLDRRIGAYELPPGWTIIAAGNRDGDSGVTYTMPAPLANRFIHEEFEVDFDDWTRWALQAGIRTEVLNFIRFRPELLNHFDPDQRSFPTPRSWQFVSDILSDGSEDPEVENGMIAGAVGKGATAEFKAFLRIYRDLPNPDAVLLAPQQAKVPTDPATLYALCGALSVRATENNFDRFMVYADRIKPEFQVLMVRDAVVRNKDLANTQAFNAWAMKNGDVFL